MVDPSASSHPMPEDACPPELANCLLQLTMAVAAAGGFPDDAWTDPTTEAALVALADLIVALQGPDSQIVVRGLHVEDLGPGQGPTLITTLDAPNIGVYTSQAQWKKLDRSAWSPRDVRRYALADQDCWFSLIVLLTEIIEAIRLNQSTNDPPAS